MREENIRMKQNNYQTVDQTNYGSARPKKRMRISIYKILRLLIIVILLVGSMYYAYTWYSGRGVASMTNAQVIEKLGDKMLLPLSEPSMMVKVKNAAELKSVDKFYKDVEDDDYVIIYSDLAIIYRPTTDKLVQVMTIAGGNKK